MYTEGLGDAVNYVGASPNSLAWQKRADQLVDAVSLYGTYQDASGQSYYLDKFQNKIPFMIRNGPAPSFTPNLVIGYGKDDENPFVNENTGIAPGTQSKTVQVVTQTPAPAAAGTPRTAAMSVLDVPTLPVPVPGRGTVLLTQAQADGVNALLAQRITLIAQREMPGVPATTYTAMTGQIALLEAQVNAVYNAAPLAGSPLPPTATDGGGQLPSGPGPVLTLPALEVDVQRVTLMQAIAALGVLGGAALLLKKKR